MIILLNPLEPDGSPIKDVWYEDQLFFKKEDNDIFQPGTVREFEDQEIASFFTNLFGFLEEVDAPTAKKYLERSKDILVCGECDFKTNTPIALAGHKRKHETEKEISALGLSVVKRLKKEGTVNTKTEQEKIEEENAREGLTLGEGLVTEGAGKHIVMS